MASSGSVAAEDVLTWTNAIVGREGIKAAIEHRMEAGP